MINVKRSPKENRQLAEDLLSRFPGVDRAELLLQMVSFHFFLMRHGNKREERAACDFLNELQREAVKLAKEDHAEVSGAGTLAQPTTEADPPRPTD